MTPARDILDGLLAQGRPAPSRVVARALSEILGKPYTVRAVSRRMRNLHQPIVGRLAGEALWAPHSIRYAYPVFGAVEAPSEDLLS